MIQDIRLLFGELAMNEKAESYIVNDNVMEWIDIVKMNVHIHYEQCLVLNEKNQSQILFQ